jgi:hypothetical protein
MGQAQRAHAELRKTRVGWVKRSGPMLNGP